MKSLPVIFPSFNGEANAPAGVEDAYRRPELLSVYFGRVQRGAHNLKELLSGPLSQPRQVSAFPYEVIVVTTAAPIKRARLSGNLRGRSCASSSCAAMPVRRRLSWPGFVFPGEISSSPWMAISE